MVAEDLLHRVDLDQVTHLGGGGVGVHVAHFRGIDAGVAEGIAHGQGRPGAVLGGRGHVVGVVAEAKTGHFTVDGGATGLGAFVFLQHHGAGAVGQHETVAVLVPGPAGALGIVVAGGERPGGGETAHAQGRGALLGAAGDHHVGGAELDLLGGEADVVGAGGAGGDGGEVGALEAVQNRQVTGDHVDDGARHEERRQLARAGGQQLLVVLLDVGETTDARADGGADALAVFLVQLQPGVADRLDGGDHAVLHEQVHLARFLGGQVVLQRELRHQAGEFGGEGLGIEVLDGPDAAAAGLDALPGAGHVRPQGAQHAQTCHYYSTSCHLLSSRVRIAARRPPQSPL